MPYGTISVDTILPTSNLAVTGNVIVSGDDTANTYNLVSKTLGTATPGRFEYDGRVPYFTPLTTQRGVIPGMQYYVLNSGLAGANATGAQSIFGVGLTVSTNTIYRFQLMWLPYKTAGTTSHTVSFGFGGTATINWLSYSALWNAGTSYSPPVSQSGYTGAITQSSGAAAVITNARTAAGEYQIWQLEGTISINAGGTLIPQYTLSAAPGGAYTISTGSWALFYPIGASGANINVGTWA